MHTQDRIARFGDIDEFIFIRITNLAAALHERVS